MKYSLKNLFRSRSGKTTEDDYYNNTEEEALRELEGEGKKVILIEPRAFSESQTIADHLKNRSPVVINFRRVTTEQAKRIIDFVSGTVYAIGGEIIKIGTDIFLCTPKNIKIQGKISEDDKKTDDDLDIEW